MKRLVILVSGKVQGVFFRASTKEQADVFGINGFVRNEPSGQVYIEAEGEEDQLEKFLRWCKQGPSRARVISVDVKEENVFGYETFAIRK